MAYRLMSRVTALVILVAVLLLPATAALAAPPSAASPSADAPAAGLWQQTWDLFAELFAGWFGDRPAGHEKATGANQEGSLLDPDGFDAGVAGPTAGDPTSAVIYCDPRTSKCGEEGSLLDPDG